MQVEVVEQQTAAAAQQLALREMATAVVVLDGRGCVNFANQQARLLIGEALRDGASLEQTMKLAGIAETLPLPRPPAATAALRLNLRDGRIVGGEIRGLPGGGWVLTLDDISVFIQEAELARRDTLTGLANRVALQTKLDQMAQARAPMALFYLDLDRFKAINDTLGHKVGDALLRRAAERLCGLADPDDTVARLGSDEFAILKAGVTRLAEAEALAARILDHFSRAYPLDGHMMNVACSLGVVIGPLDGEDGAAMLKNADLALQRAKRECRGGYRFFEHGMDARMHETRLLELDLRHALALKEFRLVYQPQVDLRSNAIVGFEALIRWDHPKRGPVGPALFIPIAEEAGLIVPIGEWVLRAACREAANWARPVSIAVNLSPLQMRDPGLINTVMVALARSGLDPTRLELEITEGTLLEATEDVVDVLNKLRELGIRVSMDDFGTGYSSLAYLQKFPFDKIKIDRSFISDMNESRQSSAIVRAAAAIGLSLGMKTTAEGVETPQQLAVLRREGCTEVQGYLTGRPMSATQAAALLVGSGLICQDEKIA